MSSAQERARVLAREIKKTMRGIKAAELRVKRLSKELTRALAQARAEAETERTIIEYPTGRYECKRCHHSTLFTEPTRELPACDNCGSQEWVGHEPTVTVIKPPPPKKYRAGMYECAHCGGRTAMAEDMDELTPCDLCGMPKLRPLDV
jgi:Zn finger protein HypA/HybF involved in hydrogenase expression